MQISGTFDVKLAPLPLHDEEADPGLGRMSIDKTFHGHLEGRSKGEMLSARTATPGSAGYVAIERVEGTLGGQNGTFILQHSGTMSADGQTLVITVVPDSGTGDLTVLSGSMQIRIEDGKHFYDFDYTLPEVE